MLSTALFTFSAAGRAQTILPRPDAPFPGVIRTMAADSTQSYPQPPKAPIGAPNVVIILLDDVGYGQMGTFGAPIATPALDALAHDGLRYTQFNTTAICSPTRASLLTGRNHHNVGFGNLENFSAGYPGYNNVWPASAASIGAILKGNGYATAWIGKNHNTPEYELGPTGPFDRWPTGLGFEYFFGFQAGDTDQWHPVLFENTNPITLPKTEQPIHLTTMLVDKAIKWVQSGRTITPDKPFLLYFAPGATHAPHQAPPHWIERFKGRFDGGWDAYRAATFKRQQKAGVLPAHAELTSRPSEIPAWPSLSADQKRLYSRMMEVYAGFTAHTDHEIGRLVDELKRQKLYDNTIFVYVAGDNGASSEGGLNGAINEMAFGNGLREDVSGMVTHIDELGSEKTYQMLPAGWAWAMDTPYRWTKTVASHFGGTRNGLVITWPKGIAQPGGVRDQFHHVNDIVPTILEAIGVPAPQIVNGVQQMPMDGTSMTYTFGKMRRDAPTHKQTQYFEIMGNRGLYHDGWFVSSRSAVPWLPKSRIELESAPWELYDLSKDPAQAHDLAASQPARLAQMKQLWWSEAKRNNVLPLDNRFLERIHNPERPGPMRGRDHVIFFSGMSRIPNAVAPDIKNRSFQLTADVDLPETGGEGVLVAQGGRFAGWSFFLDEGYLVFGYNLAGTALYRIRSTVPVGGGHRKLSISFAYDGGGAGKGGVVTLKDGDTIVGTGRLDATLPMTFETHETWDVGEDQGSAADPSYDSRLPFTLNGKLNSLDVNLR